MVVSHHRGRRTPTGSIYRKARGRRLAELGNRPSMTKIGETKSKTIRTIGGNSKTKLQTIDTCNLVNTKTKKVEQAKIESVLECPANRNYARRNILVKGTVIQTSKGKAVISNKPGQEGSVNAVLSE